MKRLRGLKDLVEEVVDKGTSAVERVHREVASRPFDVLELAPPLKGPANGIRAIHDLTVGSVYVMIRLVNRVVGVIASEVIDRLDERQPTAGCEQPKPPPAPEPPTLMPEPNDPKPGCTLMDPSSAESPTPAPHAAHSERG